MPSIEDVVAAEDQHASQSDIYRPGAVLVPNARGGHDVVVEGCVDAEPAVSVMSSSIATTSPAAAPAPRCRPGGRLRRRREALELRRSRAAHHRPGDLSPSPDCAEKVQTAARFADLSEAIVLHDVLVAIIKNTVCTRADASGAVVALGKAEAAGFAECVQESDGQVPLGYKSVPLSRLLGIDASAAVAPDVQVSRRGRGHRRPRGRAEAAQRDAAAAERRQDAAGIRSGRPPPGASSPSRASSPTRRRPPWRSSRPGRPLRRRQGHLDGSTYSVPLPQTPLVEQARDATAMPSTSRIGRLAKGYYDEKGEGRDLVLASRRGPGGEDPRSRAPAHRPTATPPPGQEQSPGTDAHLHLRLPGGALAVRRRGPRVRL